MQDLFRQRAFLRFWTARIFGTAASQMLMLAIGWHMYQRTGSAWDLGLVGLAQFAPSLATTLPAGQAADRHHRVRMVMLTVLVQGGIALVLLAGTLGDWVGRWLLLAMSVALGAIKPYQMAAQSAVLPALVPAQLLPRAQAFSSAGMQSAVIGGPALAGVLFMGGTALVYASCMVLYLVGAALCLRVHYHHVPPPREPVTLQTLLAGVRFIAGHRLMLGAVSLDLFAVLLGGATALLPIFAAEILHVGATGLGLLRSAPAVGALVVALTLARWPVSRRVGRTLLLSVLVFGLCMLVFGLSTSFWLSLLALAVSGGADMVSVVIRQTLVQLETPDHMRGRVAAVNMLFVGASNQLGEFESGATAALVGPVASVVVGGFGTILVAALWWRWFPALAQRDAFQPAAAPQPARAVPS